MARTKNRFLIYFDGKKWHARSVRAAVYYELADEMAYKCDYPLLNNYSSLESIINDLPKMKRKLNKLRKEAKAK